MEGLTAHDLPNGARFLRLHYSADPDKTPEWASAARKQDADPRTWEVQMEMRELVLEGQPVYAGYDHDSHCPVGFRKVRIPLIAHSKYVMGWDIGTASVRPAACLLQITPAERRQVHLLMEVTSHESHGVSAIEFVPAAMNAVRREYPFLPHNVIHVGDETGNSRQGATGVTSFEVAREKGVDISPISNKWEHRKTAVDRLLAEDVDETMPRFWVCGHLCPLIVQGFRGGYRLKAIAAGGSTLYGDPVKDHFSDPHDALQYAAVMAWQLMTPGDDVETRGRDGRRKKRR